jgi:hypothetical protein
MGNNKALTKGVPQRDTMRFALSLERNTTIMLVRFSGIKMNKKIHEGALRRSMCLCKTEPEKEIVENISFPHLGF